jgi:hypothetical protein
MCFTIALAMIQEGHTSVIAAISIEFRNKGNGDCSN